MMPNNNPMDSIAVFITIPPFSLELNAKFIRLSLHRKLPHLYHGKMYQKTIIQLIRRNLPFFNIN